MPAKGLGVGFEVRILELGGADAAGVLSLLVHADGAVHGVIEQHHDDGQAVLHSGRKLLSVHQEVAVARKHHHLALRPQALGTHTRRQAVTHGATGGRQLAGISGKRPEAVHPGGKVACAVAEDGVGRQRGLEMLHDLAHLQLARNLDGVGVAPQDVLGPCHLCMGMPGHSPRRPHTRQRRRECLRRGVDGLRGPVQLAQLIGIGMHMHQRLRGVGDRKQLVALRRDL